MKAKLTVIFSIVSVFNSFAQSTISGVGSGNIRTNANYFLGWQNGGTNSVVGSLDIRNDFANQSIKFFTGGSAATNERMRIDSTPWCVSARTTS